MRIFLFIILLISLVVNIYLILFKYNKNIESKGTLFIYYEKDLEKDVMYLELKSLSDTKKIKNGDKIMFDVKRIYPR